MKVRIEYAANIIVGVVLDGGFRWFVTEKEFWFLDFIKLERAFVNAGYSIEGVQGNYSDRFNIAILNEETVQEFLAKIWEYEVTIQELNKVILSQVPVLDKDDVLEYYPSLLIDFDQKILKSRYPEPASFEKFVPDGWQGVEADFLDDVPEEKRYWIIEDQDFFEVWSMIPQKGPLITSSTRSEIQKLQPESPLMQPTNMFSSDEHKVFLDTYYRVRQEFRNLSVPRGKRDFLNEIDLMEREYLARLPTYLLARCPICGGRVWEPIDTISLNGLGWTRPRTGDGWFGIIPVAINMSPKHRRVSHSGETHSFTSECDHVRLVIASLNLNGLKPDDATAPYPIRIGSERPFLMKPLIALEQTYAVIHSLPVSRFYNRDLNLHYTAHFLTYFTDVDQRLYEQVMHSAYADYELTVIDWADYDLVKWVQRGKLYWLDKDDPDLPLRNEPVSDFPYGDIKGGEGIWVIRNGRMQPYYSLKPRQWSGGEWQPEPGFFQRLAQTFRPGRRERKK